MALVVTIECQFRRDDNHQSMMIITQHQGCGNFWYRDCHPAKIATFSDCHHGPLKYRKPGNCLLWIANAKKYIVYYMYDEKKPSLCIPIFWGKDLFDQNLLVQSVFCQANKCRKKSCLFCRRPRKKKKLLCSFDSLGLFLNVFERSGTPKFAGLKGDIFLA